MHAKLKPIDARPNDELVQLYGFGQAGVPASTVSQVEDVSELLMCYPLWVSERKRTAGEIASNDDYASRALSLLPRHRYRATWHHTRREATVSMPDMPDSRADISFGVCVRRAIA